MANRDKVHMPRPWPTAMMPLPLHLQLALLSAGVAPSPTICWRTRSRGHFGTRVLLKRAAYYMVAACVCVCVCGARARARVAKLTKQLALLQWHKCLPRLKAWCLSSSEPKTESVL